MSDNPWDDPNKVIDEAPAVQLDPGTGKPGDSSLKWLVGGVAVYWMWRDKSKSKLIPLAMLWYVMTR
jgi:hypothetical protein